MVKPLEPYASISFEEAGQIYRQVLDEFGEVKSHYSELTDKSKRDMKKEDMGILSDDLVALSQLTSKRSVQEEILRVKKEETLWYKIDKLHLGISDYLANFNNTGVKKGGFD